MAQGSMAATRALGHGRLCRLVALVAALRVASRGAAAEERLIGWRGEVTLPPRRSPGGCGGAEGAAGALEARPGRWVSRGGEGHAVNYRHMAMVEPLANGTVLLAWQQAAAVEGDRRQHLVMAAADGDDAAAGFGPERRLAVADEKGSSALWGPVLRTDARRRRLALFWSASREFGCGARGAASGMDYAPGGDIKLAWLDLHTGAWSTPQLVLSQDADGGVPKVTANKPVVMSTGEWVLPYWRERAMLATGPECESLKGREGAGVVVSRDDGKTWEQRGGHIRTTGTWLIENAVTELAGGRLLMVFRSRAGFVYAATSADVGHTWTDAAPLGHPPLPNPNAKVDLLTVNLNPGSAGRPDTALVLVFNDQKRRERSMPTCHKCRTMLRLAVSRDEGRTWTRAATVEDEVHSSLRIHYPTLAQVGCDLLVAYTRFWKLHVPAGGLELQGVRVARVPLGALAAAAGGDAHVDAEM